MRIREEYIRPSLLRLEFSADIAVCNDQNCKTTSGAQGQCDATGSTACAGDPEIGVASCNVVGT